MEKATLIKVFPVQRQLASGKKLDSILIFYRDENGVKKTKFIDRAEIPYYILKDKECEEATTQPLFIEKDKVEKVVAYSDEIYRDVAVKTDALPYYDRVLINNGENSSNMKNLFKHPYLYDIDMDLADRYIRMFHDSHELNPAYKLYKCYFDIEVDIIDHNGFPDEEIAPCPINIVTLIDEKYMTVHSFVVRNPKNKSLCDFEQSIESFKNELIDLIAKEDGVVLNGMYFEFFDSELSAIEAFFALVHKKDPDFMLAWNEAFDVITLQNRLKHLYNAQKFKLAQQGISAYDMMLNTICDQKYMIQKDELGNEYYLTPRARYSAQKDKPFVDRMDYFNILDGIQWFDQLLVYANIRKSGGQKESYSLDFISGLELGKEKLEFAPGETIKNLPWKNFGKFAQYNIRDVLLLLMLEQKNLDINLLQLISEITSTRTEKVLKKTISLKNFVNKFANEQGYIMNNNKNAKYGNDYEYFEQYFIKKKNIVEHDSNYLELFDKKENFGAYVGDPNLNTNKNGVEIVPGKPNAFILENVFDMDFSALYPSIIQSFNLAPTSQIGKFFLISPEIKQKLVEGCGFAGMFVESSNGKKDSDIPDDKTDLGPVLSDFLQSMNFSKIGEIFMDLPSTEDLLKEINKTM